MTVSGCSTTIQLSVPAHPTAEGEELLERYIRLQRLARTELWSLIRAGLGSAAADRTWRRPTVLEPILQGQLYELTAADDWTGQSYIDRVVSREAGRLRRLPHRVGWEDLQPGTDPDELSVPGRPFLLGQDFLRLPGLDLEIDGYVLPLPFRTAVLHPGAERLAKQRGQIVDDLEAWDQARGEVDVPTARRYQRHAVQCGQLGKDTLPVPVSVPGVQVRRAVLCRRLDQVGDRRWACKFTFTVSPDAVRTWFPQAVIGAPVGIDPGMGRPLTWASAGTGQSLHHALIDLTAFPGHQGEGARVVRRAGWERLVSGYDRVWTDVLRHKIVRVEDTNWTTLADENPDFISRARDNHLWSWLSHLVAMAPLTGSQIEYIDPRATSCICSECGHHHAYRQQTTFVCAAPSCGYTEQVDANAALIIAQAKIPRRDQKSPACQNSTEVGS